MTKDRLDPRITFSGVESLARLPAFRRFGDGLENALRGIGHGDAQTVHVAFGPALARPNGRDRATASAAARKGDETRDFAHAVREPRFTWDRLVLPPQTAEDILLAIRTLEVERQVFDGWGLRAIGEPRAALNFFGPPGTGKTAAAHAIAHRLGLEIIELTYADLVSKFFGEGAQNVKQVFDFAAARRAVLFVDEADSLLSKRLVNSDQPAGQAINSMRSELLTAIEKHSGIVIFATNLIENYDPAFDTRVKHVRFELPDREMVQHLWAAHLVRTLPLAQAVDPVVLADRFPDLCGRDIKSMVIDAAVRTAIAGRASVGLAELDAAYRAVVEVRRRDGQT